MINDKFLDSFRALDSELKLNGTTVLDFENTLEGTDQEKLKVCRIMRNYMAHNDTSFLTASNEQSKFLDSLTTNLRKKAHIVKDEMKRIKAIKYTEPIKNVLAQIVKFPIVPIETKLGIFLVTESILLDQLSKGNKKIAIPVRLPKYKYVSKTDRLDSITSGTYIVTEDGTAKSTYIGLLKL